MAQVDLDDCGVVSGIGTPKPARLAGWVALAERLAKASGVAAFCGLCAVIWLVVVMELPGGYVLLVALVTVGKREPPLEGLTRAGGRGGWTPWEGSGAR